jgi:hypothetical protein
MEQGETRETTRKPIGEVSTSIQKENIKIILSANTDWYLNNFRLPLINQLQSLGAEFVLVSPPGPLFVKLRFWVRVICRTMNNGIIKL